jgi:CheY-like chemotaxis protein
MSPMLAGFTLDITDRKNAEKDIISARDKAERSDKLKDAFLQNMSHEIRTPMNAIIGFAELLQNVNIPNEKRNNYISIIVNSSNQLLAIVNDILTVSRIQMGQEVLNNSYTDINRLIAEISIIYRSKIENSGLSFVINNTLNEENFVIQTDGTKLIQIISNLLNNSIKFTSKGFIEFSCMLENNLLKFCVKDTGIGIKPEMQTLIFERFMQADYSISKNYGGTGLGLSICKAYAELLGGNIGVNSKPGSGSEFYFTIACNRVDPIQRMKVSQVTVEDNITKTILVAEDEIYNFQLIKEILSNKYILISADNGLEAVKKFKQYPEIDLILMDIKMPEMDGVTAMKEIKKIRADVPVIAQTAYALDDEKQEFMKSGFNDYITKPLNRIELLSKVAQYLNMD